MKKIILGVLILLLFFSHETFAFLEGAEPGGSLTMGIGARAMGMGGAYCAIAEDVSAAYWNPAGLVQIKQREFSTMHSNLSEGREYNYFGIANPSSSGGVFAISYAQFKIGGFEERDKDNNLIGTFDYSDSGCLLSYASQEREGIKTGISVKYLKQEVLDASAKGWGIDLGILYDIPKVSAPFDSAKIGMVVQNITETKIKWKNTATNPKEKVPANFKIGISGKLMEEKLTLALDYGEKDGTRIGCEYWLKEMLGVRAGSSSGNKTFGASFKMQKYQIDYAYVEEELDNGQRVSFTMRF